VAGQPFIAPSSALDRRRLGKFEVLCRLSAGGMSQIYLATQSGIGGFRKLVVLKTILPDIGGEEDFVRMFLEEARTTAAFNHPNIAQVFELDVDAGELFMAMEFVQGCTLVEMAKACRAAREPIPVGFTLQSVRDTALALHYAHNFTDARGRKQIVIHRDVAEKNIMVTYEGVTKLLDFGIAKALGRRSRTSVGMVKGTSGYMSPEQIRGEPLDSRTDVFSLGVVLHECLTGLRLFHGKNAEEGMVAALSTNVTPPSRTNPEVRPEVDTVVMKALQRKREDRFASALEFGRALEKAAPGLIWHPEQSAELVSRHFADRRAETRRLLDSTNFGGETTGELRIESLIAMVKTTDNRAAATVPQMPPLPSPPIPWVTPSPTPPTGIPNSLRRASQTSTGSTSSNQTAQESDTNPARPKVLRATAPSAPDLKQAPPSVISSVPMVVRLDPVESNYDEESEAKTIPAAALPSEIRAVRAKLTAAKPLSPERAGAQETTVSGLPSVLVAPENETRRPVAPAHVKTIPAGPLAEPAKAGETKDVATAWVDDEPEEKTTIETMRPAPRLQSGPQTSVVTEPENNWKLPALDRDVDFDDDDDARNRSFVILVAVLVTLFIAAVILVLSVAGLPPFGRSESPVPTRSTIKPLPEVPEP
jgi:eukaryotic-like serine/threonine-protein kinase